MKNIHGEETGIVLRDEIRKAVAEGETFPFFQVRMAKEHDICVRYQVWHSVVKETKDDDEIERLRKENAAMKRRLAKGSSKGKK